jgi:hypothetical protein
MLRFVTKWRSRYSSQGISVVVATVRDAAGAGAASRARSALDTLALLPMLGRRVGHRG